MYEVKWGAEVNCSPKSRCKFLLEIFSVIRNITSASSSVVAASTSVISYKILMVTVKKRNGRLRILSEHDVRRIYRRV